MSNLTGCLYDPATGKILGIYSGVNEASLIAQKVGDNAALDHILGFCTFADYITGEGAITARTDLVADFDVLTIAADGIEVATLETLPEPCVVFVDGTPYDVIDGIFEFTADAAGDYIIKVSEVAYLDKEWMINAT